MQSGKSIAILAATATGGVVVFTQSRITSRPSVKVFNGSSLYRRAIRSEKARQELARKREREYEDKGERGRETPFLLFRAVYFSRENSVA